MSALYKVMRDNDYFDAGIFVEEMSDGFVQPVELVQDGKFHHIYIYLKIRLLVI